MYSDKRALYCYRSWMISSINPNNPPKPRFLKGKSYPIIGESNDSYYIRTEQGVIHRLNKVPTTENPYKYTNNFVLRSKKYHRNAAYC